MRFQSLGCLTQTRAGSPNQYLGYIELRGLAIYSDGCSRILRFAFNARRASVQYAYPMDTLGIDKVSSSPAISEEILTLP